MSGTAPAGRSTGAGIIPRFVLAVGAATLAGTFLLALWCPTPKTPAATDRRASLGATFRNDRPKQPAELSWPEEKPGAEVATTVEGGPAFLAGWRAGDRIERLGGRPVTSACQLEREIARLPIGNKVTIDFVREGGTKSESIAVEPVDGVAFFDRLCGAGQADACGELGRLRIAASHTTADVDGALGLYERACQGGDASSCSELAGHLIERAAESEIEGEIKRSESLARKGCDGGFPSACAHLGFLYSTGRGMSRDDTRATALFEVACDGGDPAGCYNVGLMYEKQRGVPRNDARALLGYVHGCEGGYPQACTNLGFLYDRGIGVIANPERAARLYERACPGDACTAGDPIGCLNFGIFLRDGRGVARDESRAIELFERSCGENIGAACNNLGILIEASDAERALELFRKGCRLGSSGGCKNAADGKDTPP